VDNLNNVHKIKFHPLKTKVSAYIPMLIKSYRAFKIQITTNMLGDRFSHCLVELSSYIYVFAGSLKSKYMMAASGVVKGRVLR